MEYKDLINDYKINIDTYSKLIKEIKNLPESKIDFSNIFINTVKNATNQTSQIFDGTESTVSPNLDDEQEKEDLLEENQEDSPKEEPLPKEAPLPKKEEPLPKEEEPLPKEEEPLPKEEEPLPKEAPLPKEEIPLPKKEESINILNLKNYTIIEPIKKLTSYRRINIKGNIKGNMKGGSNKTTKEKIRNLLLNSDDNILANIMTYYYYSEDHKILNGTDIINIMISIIYTLLINPELQFSEILSSKYIESIPEIYRFNFNDKVMKDLGEDISKIEILNENVNELKKILYNNMSDSQKLQNPTNIQQTGGKSSKNQNKFNDKTVEEKIQKNIANISAFLKTNSNKPQKQFGGSVSPAEMLVSIMNFNNLPDPKPKDKISEIKNLANNWVVELIQQNIATKEIRDDQYKIARFYITADANVVDKKVLDFINDNASILTLKDDDRIKSSVPNQITVAKIGNAKRGNITDKLEEHFKKKYQELLDRQNANYEEIKDRQKKYPTLQVVIDSLRQRGGSNEELEEKCFTSKQYTLFLKKMANYIKLNGKRLDESSIEEIQKEIETLDKIEKRFVEINKLFNNYVKIYEALPTNSRNNVTLEHIESINTENKDLLDTYGKVNYRVINTIKTIEKYSELLDAREEASKYPNLKKEMDRMEQSGGGQMKSYMKFNTQDVEYFVSRSFAEFVEKNKDEIYDKK